MGWGCLCLVVNVWQIIQVNMKREGLGIGVDFPGGQGRAGHVHAQAKKPNNNSILYLPFGVVEKRWGLYRYWDQTVILVAPCVSILAIPTNAIAIAIACHPFQRMSGEAGRCSIL